MKTLALVLMTLMSSPTLADDGGFEMKGGSITKREALSQVASENMSLAMTLNKIDLAEFGEAARVGSHFPGGGQRVMPFTFATVDGTVTVTIDHDDSGGVVVFMK